MNWIPVLQMQKYHSITEVTVELKHVWEKRKKVVNAIEENINCCDEFDEKTKQNIHEEEEGSLKSHITDHSGSQELQPALEHMDVTPSLNHEERKSRTSQIKIRKVFSAKEHVKGHMVNVVRGLKLYEDVFTNSELSKLTDFVNELRVAGQNGELSGQSFILFNKDVKGNRREMIQLGVPLYDQIEEEAACNYQSTVDPIPVHLQGIIDQMVQLNLLPEHRKPNSCIINFFEENYKAPHLEQPISVLILSDSTMAFGRVLTSESDGNYKAPFHLPLKPGSLLVMRGHSAVMAGHAMCASPFKRISISFFRVRQESVTSSLPIAPSASSAMILWQPGVPISYGMQNATMNGYKAIDMMPKCGAVCAP